MILTGNLLGDRDLDVWEIETLFGIGMYRDVLSHLLDAGQSFVEAVVPS